MGALSLKVIITIDDMCRPERDWFKRKSGLPVSLVSLMTDLGQKWSDTT